MAGRVGRPIHVIRDGVYEEVLKQVSNREKDQPSNSNILLIFVGQINHSRLDSLMRVMPGILEEAPGLQLQVVGSGPDLARYMEMVKSLGLRDKISFKGHVSHEKVFDYIKKADMAYSDDWSVNGFPMKIFEYMAMGKPVVVESTESIKELLTDKVNALLYENERELNEKLIILAKDSNMRRDIAERAKEMMRDHTWEKRMEALQSIYRCYLPQ